MPREFFKADGKPESRRDKAFRGKIEKAFRRQTQASEIPESAKQYLEIADDFPFAWLNQVFERVYGKTMAGNFADLIGGAENIKWDDAIQDVGSHQPLANVIRLNAVRLENKLLRADEFKVEKNFGRKMLLARVLIHEAVHVYSKIRGTGQELVRGVKKSGVLQVTSGLETQRLTIHRGSVVGEPSIESRDLNEGLVDLVAEDIFTLYLQEEGIKGLPQVEQFQQFLAAVADPYKNQKFFILDIVDRVSADAGVDFGTAYQGMIHQLFSGGVIAGDVETWISEIVGHEAFENIKKGTSTDLSDKKK